MAKVASKYLYLCLLFLLTICSSGISQPREFGHKELQREEEQMFHSSQRELLNNFHYKTTQHDTVYPPTTFPTTPVNNPTPTIVTVPSTNPASTPLTVPSTNPATSLAPITNPVTTPSTVPAVTNPVTTYPAPTTGVPATTPVTNPVAPPATTGGSPAVPGQSWCVVRSGSPESSLQAALDYACGIGGADCSVIQQGASCYNPSTLENHASYAFNSYYQKNPLPTSCDFGGTAIITNINPSTGTCIYPSSSSPSSSPITTTNPTPPTTTTTNPTPPTTTNPTPPTTTNPTPTTTSSSGGTVTGYGSPTVLNSSNPASTGSPIVFGDSPPSFNNATSMASSLQPFIGCVILVTSIVAGTFVLESQSPFI